MKVYSPQGGSFDFALPIVKSETNSEGKMIIKGLASNTAVDSDDHRFTRIGLESIKQAIEDGLYDDDGDWNYIPLRSGHGREWNDQLGWITKAEIDDKDNLWITAELDEESSDANTLYRRIARGNRHGKKSKLGMSVKGKTTQFTVGYDPDLGRKLTSLNNLLVEEVSITSEPKNPSAYSIEIAKSVLADPEYQKAMDEPWEEEPHMEETLDVTKSDEVTNSDEQVTTSESEALDENRAAAAVETAADADVPAGYVALPVQDTTENAQEVATETTEEVVAETSDPVATLQSTVDALTQAMAALSAVVTQLQTQPQEVQKSEQSTVEETPAAPPVIVDTLDDKIALAVSKAVTDAFTALNLGALAEEIGVVKSNLALIANAPADKSLSVSKAKDEDNNDPFQRMRALKDQGQDSISAALHAAYRN